MRDTLTRDNVRDFTARYNKTFGWFLGESKRVLVRVEGVGDSRVQFQDINGTNYFAAAGQGVMFEFLPVTKGLYNTADDRVIFVSRVPARQWHRGICAQNTQMFEYSPRYSGNLIDVNINNVSQVFESKVDVNKRIERYLKSALPVALDKHFALAHGQVLFMNHRIGSITGDKISLANPMFRQELSDVIRRNSFPLTING